MHARDSLGILWERPSHRRPEPAVPRSVSAARCALLREWLGTRDLLAAPLLAFRVVGTYPDTEAMAAPALGAEQAREVYRRLRAGESVETSLVVRLARFVYERRDNEA